MAESSPPPSRSRFDRDDDDSPRSRPLRLIDQAARASQPSHPPSEPRPIAGRPGADASPDRPARVQLIAALLLLLVLVVVPLYLWRRPRAAATDEAKAAAAAALASAQLQEATTVTPPAPSHTKDGVTITDTKVVGCHDSGSKHTSPAACDRLPTLEAALSKAVLDSSSCIPAGTPSGGISYVLDVSYGRHKAPLKVTRGHDGTTLPQKIVAACIADVKKSVAATPLDTTHAHARYEIELAATYAAKR